MILEQAYNEITDSFSKLWKTKVRGNTLEIVTPYATTNNRFVSVFITKQGDDFVVTDGGWISSGIYSDTPLIEADCFSKAYNHFVASFEIKELETPNGTYYYLKTPNSIDVPAKVFDLATFIQNIVSLSDVNFESKNETETKKRFYAQARKFLQTCADPAKIKFSQYLNPEKKELRFNAIFFNTINTFTLVNYITGSTQQYFENSIFKSNTLFEMAELSVFKPHIHKKISFVDTTASGYKPERIAHYLNHLKTHTGSELVSWHEKEKLLDILK